MTLKETTTLAYSIYLYKTRDYDCFKYNFKISSRMNTSIQQFFDKNKFYLDNYTVYTPEQTKMRLVINFFVLNRNIVSIVPDKDYDLFVASLIEYRNEIQLFKNKIQSKEVTAEMIYSMFIKKEIPFYIFWYSNKFLKYKKSFLSNELMKMKMKNTSKLMKFFPFFDEGYIKGQFKELQQKIDLS